MSPRPQLRILADRHIACAKEAFSTLGEVILASELTAESVRDASVLVVRSVTRVDAALLQGSAVRFVGTTTIGTDHVDVDWLRRHGIGFAAAPGSNANAVAEYVVAALMHLSRLTRRPLQGMTLGIIGVGNIGSRVATYASLLGMRCLLNDPPLQRRTRRGCFLPLDTITRESDIITVHVPLTRTGRDPTYRLVNDRFLASLKPGAALINASRGGVHDEEALARHRRRLGGLVLDVWNNEPGIAPATVRHADIATPHIAGYSYEGRVRATHMVSEAACRHFGLRPGWVPDLQVSRPAVIDVRSKRDPVGAAVLAAHPLLRDDRRLRGILRRAPAQRAAFFSQLRAGYVFRREFACFQVHCTPRQEAAFGRGLAGLGFAVRVTG